MPRKKKRKAVSQTKPKEQPFNAPFAALGKALKGAAPPPAPAAPAPPPKPEPEPAAEDLFAAAMRGVRPLPSEKRGRVTPAAPAAQPPREALAEDEDLEVMARLADLVSGEGEFDLRFSDLYVQGAQPGVGPELLERLAAGAFPIQDHLDLHGLSVDQAQAEAESFIAASVTRGLRHVLIVHGKGKGSPGGVPVLKQALTGWLATRRFQRNVLAFCSAQGVDGGMGAMYLLLRRWSGPGRPRP
ncbi:MAG: DNA mismatch repair protein MutS [Desulfarculus sp.]|nr:MAG: DNA mismatch repair protein MutS [Desulfarculus sp.]